MIASRWIATAALGAAGLWLLWSWLQPDHSPGTGEVMAVVTVPELTAREEDGQSIFDQNCATCHGDNAAGRDGIGPPLVHRIYEPSHHGDAAFLIAVENGVRQHHWQFGNMSPVDGVSEVEVRAIIDYVRALQRANGIE